VRRCTVLHQAVPEGAPPDERDVLDAAAAVAEALGRRGWAVASLGMDLNLGAAAAALGAQAPELVFNLVESLGGGGALAVAAPALLDRLGLAYTGNGLAALALTADKRATRRALRNAGIPVPPAAEDGWPGPFIVKHATEHASFGLGAHSVVAGPPAPPPGWFAEAYVEGREFNLSLLAEGGAVQALPAAEMLFCDWPAGVPRIVDYAGKWLPAQPTYQRTVRSFAVEPALAKRLQGIAVACWRALGLAGYARIDMRLAADGVACVIDVNANPCLSPDAGFAAAAAAAGLDFDDLVERIAVVAERASRIRPTGSTVGRLREARSAVRADGWAFRDQLRPTDDIAALCRATGVFADAEITIAEELAADRRTRGDASDYRFLLADGPEGLAGYACFGPTPCTLSAWDLYWIVVHPRAQGRGLGRALVAAVLHAMRQAGGSRLYAETAGKPLYAPTRAFYAAAGFILAAVVADFYAPGDAKQIWLRLAAGAA
jgi:D-alanine-D-alanine ligase-like ATP-grasp enzyme/GNAT superfamily N-acetyltransferase